MVQRSLGNLSRFFTKSKNYFSYIQTQENKAHDNYYLASPQSPSLLPCSRVIGPLREIKSMRNWHFLNRFRQRMTTRGIASQLKHFAEKYGVNRDVVYPHSFRQRFAKNFLDRFTTSPYLLTLWDMRV